MSRKFGVPACHFPGIKIRMCRVRSRSHGVAALRSYQLQGDHRVCDPRSLPSLGPGFRDPPALLTSGPALTSGSVSSYTLCWPLEGPLCPSQNFLWGTDIGITA